MYWGVGYYYMHQRYLNFDSFDAGHWTFTCWGTILLCQPTGKIDGCALTWTLVYCKDSIMLAILQTWGCFLQKIRLCLQSYRQGVVSGLDIFLRFSPLRADAGFPYGALVH